VDTSHGCKSISPKSSNSQAHECPIHNYRITYTFGDTTSDQLFSERIHSTRLLLRRGSLINEE